MVPAGARVCQRFDTRASGQGRYSRNHAALKNPRHPRIAVLGLGLIGGSLALALRRRGIRVTGVDPDPRARAIARRRGAVVAATSSLREGVREAGIVVLAVPIQALARCLRGIAAWAPRSAVITDVASVKGPVVGLARRHLPCPGRFVGGHPMAGRETSGLAHARADLFRERVCVLTPVAGTSGSALRAVRRLWAAAGARVIELSPRRHDAAVARASHLPHLMAYALAPVLAGRDSGRIVSGSFLDATRVAASDPALWEGILLSNRREVLGAVREQAAREARLLRLLRENRPGPLRRALADAAQLRRRVARTRQ
ncbi:MAG: prephenate dehydrogenase/arogenate dehydrogenase family protein [Candidatus Coatesbacteria bacterium]